MRRLWEEGWCSRSSHWALQFRSEMLCLNWNCRQCCGKMLWEEMGLQNPSLEWLSCGLGVWKLLAGCAHRNTPADGELRAVCDPPVAAEPRAGLGLFLTMSAAGAGLVALLNPSWPHEDAVWMFWCVLCSLLRVLGQVLAVGKYLLYLTRHFHCSCPGFTSTQLKPHSGFFSLEKCRCWQKQSWYALRAAGCFILVNKIINLTLHKKKQVTDPKRIPRAAHSRWLSWLFHLLDFV